MKDFIISAEKALCNIFDLSESRVYLIQNNKLVWYKSKTLDEVYFEITTGIIGKCIHLNKEVNSENGENDPLFNHNVDLPTTLPLYSLPIRHLHNKKKVIGCI